MWEIEVLYGREVDLSFPEPGNYSITYRAIDDEAKSSATDGKPLSKEPAIGAANPNRILLATGAIPHGNSPSGVMVCVVQTKYLDILDWLHECCH